MPFDLMSEIEVFARVETRRPIGPVEQALIEARELISTPEKWARSSRELGDKHCIVSAVHCATDRLLSMEGRRPIHSLLEKAAGCNWIFG